MGQRQSSESPATGSAADKADYYDLLGVDRNATDDEIKKAYRRKALELHPDRNYGNVEDATKLFAEVQTAYQVLSDVQERAWYDSHRDVLLRGDDAAAGDGNEFSYNIRMTTAVEVQKLTMRFNGKLDYSDTPSGFFGGLSDFFNQLAKEEDIACQWEDEDPVDYPEFGMKADDYGDIVRPFYAYWTGFATKKSYAWKDEYRLSDAPDRRIRRLMEKANKKLREEAIQDYNDAVRSLVAFVRRRDPRVQDNQKSEAERQKILKNAAAAQAARARAQRQAQFKDVDVAAVPSWSQPQAKDAFEGVFSSESDIEEHEYDCVVCDKTFKSEAQFNAHEKSKKHQKLLKQLKRDMRHEDPKGNAEPEHIDEHVAQDEGIEDEEDPRRERSAQQVAETRESDGGAVSESVNADGPVSNADTLVNTESSDDDHAPREGVESRLRNKEVNGMADRLAETSLDGTPATSDTESAVQLNVGKAKLKRAKRAEKQAAGVTATSDFNCVSCRASFPSKSKLFEHLKDKPSHAALKSATTSAKGKKGKKK